MTTLITGGAGFIGSRLATHLVKQNEPIVILDNFDPFYDPAVKRGNIANLGSGAVVIEGDIRDVPLVERIFAEYKITQVAHLAALANVRKSIERGPDYADVNTTASVSLMNIARKHEVSIFIQGSTSSVYGETTRVPFSEAEAPDQPLAPYPASKRAAEIFGYSYNHLFGLNVTVLRFFNVYGPHGRPDMMPIKVIDSILNDRVITVYDDGKLQRDWTFIDDTVAGIMAALEKPLGYRIINLGYGSPIPLTDFIRIYENLIGKKALTSFEAAPTSEPHITYCDNTLARQLLGFNPQVKIEDGLARTWEWYRATHNVP